MNDFQVLDWDTEILGIKTAKILPEKLSLKQLKSILVKLKKQNVKLVYWLTDSQDEATQQAANQCAGFLADNKVTYLLNLGNIDPAKLASKNVEIYQKALPDSQLKKLAVEIGVRSRFGVDPKISRQQMEKVYKTWIRNSIKKQVAKVVLVIKLDNKIIGMVTIAEKNNRGDLSLVSVDPHYRGLHLGVHLVRAAQLWCIESGYRYSQVVTQVNNIAACKLYEKCGYRVEKVENFYHFWL